MKKLPHGALFCHRLRGKSREAGKGECLSDARQGGCMVFAAEGGIRNGAEGAVPRQRSDTIYLPRARARSPPVRRSRSQAEPWQPRAERPGGWLNPHARKGVSTFGNTGKHRAGPGPDLDRATDASNFRTFAP